jgi:hypothetical protein
MREDMLGLLFRREAAVSMGGMETDYLVVGAGAAGMAFVDALIADSDADVVMVDRRHCPAGHWNDAYPFVRLHSPSALYGVNSRVLGSDIIEQTGPNAGFYPRASAVEIRDYYQRVLDEVLLPSGQVRFIGMSDYAAAGGEHQFTSRLTGETTTVTVRRRVVDARFLEPAIPATHVPPFEVAPEARLIPVNDLVELSQSASGFTILGGGKTAIDACLWLLDSGVPPEAIRWIRGCLTALTTSRLISCLGCLRACRSTSRLPPRPKTSRICSGGFGRAAISSRSTLPSSRRPGGARR